MVRERVPEPAVNRTATGPNRDRRGRGTRFLTGGGIDGNEQLTAVTGVILIVLLAVLGATIVRIRQLIWLHLFLGLLLLGPVLLKTASTGYRCARYYVGAAVYRAKGPPMPALRAMGPIVVLSTVVVFVSGVILLYDGPHRRGTLLVIHKVSFIVWLVFMAIHVLAHLPALGRSLQAVRIGAEEAGLPALHARSGAAGRWIALAGAVVAGLVLALVLLPHFGIWTAPGAFPRHHEH